MNTGLPVLVSGVAHWLLADACLLGAGRHIDGYDLTAAAMVLITLAALRRLRDQG